MSRDTLDDSVHTPMCHLVTKLQHLHLEQACQIHVRLRAAHSG